MKLLTRCAIVAILFIALGGFSSACGLVSPTGQSTLDGLLPAVPDIVLSELKTDAAILGAVATALRQTSDALFVQSVRA